MCCSTSSVSQILGVCYYYGYVTHLETSTSNLNSERALWHFWQTYLLLVFFWEQASNIGLYSKGTILCWFASLIFLFSGSTNIGIDTRMFRIPTKSHFSHSFSTSSHLQSGAFCFSSCLFKGPPPKMPCLVKYSGAQVEASAPFLH